MTTLIRTPPKPLNKTNQFTFWLNQHWVLMINFFLGIFIIIPFLAPAFMALGLEIPGKIIYWVYSFLCHQLPERSYFLFGPKISYTLPEIQSAWQNTNDFIVLRQFVGNSQMGWKVAWSDRMVSMFTSLWLSGILWSLIKKKIKPLPWRCFVLLLLPLIIDGATHFFSDLAGIGQGFRDSNAWLATLTINNLPANFYAGDAWGSFNAWMRLISGLFFGVGVVWFGFAYLDEAITKQA